MYPLGSGLIFTYLCINNTFCSGFIMHSSDFFNVSFFHVGYFEQIQNKMKVWDL